MGLQKARKTMDAQVLQSGWIWYPANDPTVTRKRANARLRQVVDHHLDFVARVLRNLGTPDGDVDDAVQKTFMVLSDRLDRVRPGAEKAFLFQTAANVAAHVRRTLARRREVAEDRAPERPEEVPSPEALADRSRARTLLDQVLAALDDDARAVFVLYEIEEMTMAEIATALDLAPGTVASRLRRARGQFKDAVRRLQTQGREMEAS
jgi:RNA polymerase sigma-70 factor (ECF subfamily)